MNFSRHLPLALLLAALTVCATSRIFAARLEVLEVRSTKLKANPPGDPSVRRVAMLVPDATKNGAPLPLVIYLPGWGGSSEDVIAQGGGWLARAVDKMAGAGLALRIAVVDGRSHFGGSQFLNSGATGDYADYVADEIVAAVEARYPLANDAAFPRIIAGHSSGGYGALMLAMSRHEKFSAVVALSPDSDFEVTHKPIVSQPSVRAITPAELERVMTSGAKARLPGDGLAHMVMGLCANYAPIAGKPGHFEWLYDAGGKFRAEAWQRWLDVDPLHVVRKRADAFAPAQRVYLDGAEHDEFGANIGARKIWEVLRERKSPVTFYESPGHHSDHLAERLVSGLGWVIGK
ncbi:MAG: alpha/beta hydrolase-fold protein [Chthoniobacteraceae bacterium]